MSAAIRNIVFDMGGVLIHFVPDHFISRLGITDEADRKLLFRQVFRSVEWSGMDWGMLTDAEAAESICRRMPERLHQAVRSLVLKWDEQPMEPMEGMYELIEELKENGYRIYLLSNASSRHPDYWPKIPASRLFDGVLVSYSVKTVKPQQEIYAILCERFGLRPEECFFIDDLPVNAAGARKYGMSSMVFHEDMEELRNRLREAGVKIK